MAAMCAHVLVADDDPRQAEVVRRYLAADGHEAHVVHDGPAALDAARRLRPDLARARRADARHERPAGVPHAAPGIGPAGADADRPGHRGRPAARPRAGRRRLPDQAVQSARADGPPSGEREFLVKVASDELGCLARAGRDGHIETGPSGRPAVVAAGGLAPCEDDLRKVTTGTEKAALDRLAAACPGSGRVGIDFKATVPGGQTCVDRARRAQLEPYVAPPALLFVSDPAAGGDQTRFTLSSGNVIRIVAVTGAILLAAVIATIVAGRRLVHPLRALTSAADGNVPAAVSTRSPRDEIGRLARALNDSTERRDRAEAQHRALVSDVAHELRTPLTNIRPLGGAGLGEQLLVAAHGLDRASVRA
jgi:HAMP domain-containing protein